MKKNSSTNHKKRKMDSSQNNKKMMNRRIQKQIPQESRDRIHQIHASNKSQSLINGKRRASISEAKRSRSRTIKKTSRILPMFVFCLVMCYLLGQMILMSVKREPVDVETVGLGTLNTPEKFEGLIVRDEYVETSNRDGVAVYGFAEGEYISKNKVVAAIKDIDTTIQVEDKLLEVDETILKNQKNRSDLSIFSADISRIEEEIQETINTYVGESVTGSMEYVYDMKSRIQASMNQRNEIWIAENIESLSQLSDERVKYEEELALSTSNILSKESGILTFTYDGLEEILTLETIDEVTKAQIGESDIKHISKGQLVSQGDSIYKMITSNLWSIVAYLPNQDILGWEEGRKDEIYLVTENDQVAINVVVDSIELGELESKVVFTSYDHMNEFMNQRLVEIYIESNVYEGLKVSNGAIVEKSLIEIPRNCVIENEMGIGVSLKTAETETFLPIIPVASNEEYYYIEQSQGVTLGDIIIADVGENPTSHTVTAVKPISGVYLANSSVAKFTVIDIIEQNQEYAIIRSDNHYGLQSYDLIVSDAKNITEGQNLY